MVVAKDIETYLQRPRWWVYILRSNLGEGRGAKQNIDLLVVTGQRVNIPHWGGGGGAGLDWCDIFNG